jgi:hypothetical protein
VVGIMVGAVLTWKAAVSAQRAFGRDERRFEAYADCVMELRNPRRNYDHLLAYGYAHRFRQDMFIRIDEQLWPACPYRAVRPWSLRPSETGSD